jgi:hypothetical protein
MFGKGELLGLPKIAMRPNIPNDEWYMIGFGVGVTKEEVKISASRAQGAHAEHMLIIFEETPGVHEAVMTAFENSCSAEHNIVIAVGNPNSQQDLLHQFCKKSNVTHVRISGADYPNVVLDQPNFIPGAQSRFGKERMLAKYKTEDSPMFRSRWNGISPEQGVDSLIRWEWCVEASQREPKGLGEMALGVDVANSEDGDLAAIARGQGSSLTHIEDFPCPNSNQLGDQAFILMKRFNVSADHVGVDGVGVGAGTVNKLLEYGQQIVNIQSGAKAQEVYSGNIRMQEEFNNLRSQMWWQMRLDLQFGDESGLVLPFDEELFVDLCAPKWKRERNFIVVESKDTIKKRLGRSPNKGDAVVYWNWVRQRRTGEAAAVLSGPEDERERAHERSPYMAERRRTW